jgi:hypothetical protein
MRVHTAASTFGPSFSEIITGAEDENIAEVDAVIVSIPPPHGILPKALVRCNRPDDEKGSIQTRRKTLNHCIIPFPLQHAQ